MKKVLIWGQYWMLDAQLAEPVRAAIESLTEHGEETVFYFLDRTEFSALCLSQLRALRQATGRPCSAVYLSVADCSRPNDDFYRQMDGFEYPFGKIRPEEAASLMMDRRRMIAAQALDRCDTLLCYFYPVMAQNRWRQVLEAHKRPHQILNLMRPATQQDIPRYMRYLMPEQRFVFERSLAGKSTRQIVADMGDISPERVDSLRAEAVVLIGRRMQLRARIDAKKDRHRDSHVSPI